MQIPVNSIVVHERVRKDIGDLQPLMDSMTAHGQLNPIVITRTRELIAGRRRLLAARQLGWYTIEAVSVDRDSPVDKLAMELEENVHRKDFLPAELLEGYARLEKLRRPRLTMRLGRFFRRVWTRLAAFFRKEDAGPEDESGHEAYDTSNVPPLA
ncbi:MAG: ParB N-terminal domain-containing protein [Lentisphaerae bacterium]|nr:ParB N-terminal domain-containing protein [Lentisphaerota bacterium]